VAQQQVLRLRVSLDAFEVIEVADINRVNGAGSVARRTNELQLA